MRKHLLLLMVVSLYTLAAFADMKVVRTRGDVSVRRGMNEQWQKVAPGDVLKPEDSIMLKKNSSATILIDGRTMLSIPEQVILDLADLREMSQEELLLKLAMETIRSLPLKKSHDDLEIPTTTTIHGKNVTSEAQIEPTITESDKFRLNGVKVLYQNKYYAGCVLRAKEIFRLLPSLANLFEIRFLVAQALEAMKLKGEALSEYYTLLNEHLSPKNRATIEARIKALQKTTEHY